MGVEGGGDDVEDQAVPNKGLEGAFVFDSEGYGVVLQHGKCKPSAQPSAHENSPLSYRCNIFGASNYI
jgi:hypothetical protein